MIPVLRLAGVLAAGAGVVAAGTVLRLPELDLSTAGWSVGPARGVASTAPPESSSESSGGSSGGSAPASAGGALAARTEPVQRAELVCPGPEMVGVRGVQPVGRPPAPAEVHAAAPPADVRPDAPAIDGVPDVLVQPGADARVLSRSLPGGRLHADSSGAVTSGARLTGATTTKAAGVRLAATGAEAPGLVATQTTLVPAGDLRGLSSATCVPASDDVWLVAGGTEAGRRGRLVLVNPADNPVDVDVDVLGERGPVPRSAGSSVQVPARSRTVLLLDALAPGVRSPVLHVTTTAGAVAATLSDAWLSGTTPQGVDDAVAAADPSREALVPALLGGGPSSVRIASTGPAEAVAQVRLLGPSGPVPVAGGGVLRVPARGTRSVDLGTLPAGGYLVDVVSDAPVVAGALVQRAGAAGELAWFGSAAPAGALVGGAGLRGGAAWSSSLVLAAPRDRVEGELVTVRSDGSSRTAPVDVAPGTVATVATGEAVAAWVRPQAGTGELVAARATTHDDPAGQLVTGGALAAAPLQERRPAVVPAR